MSLETKLARWDAGDHSEGLTRAEALELVSALDESALDLLEAIVDRVAAMSDEQVERELSRLGGGR